MIPGQFSQRWPFSIIMRGENKDCQYNFLVGVYYKRENSARFLYIINFFLILERMICRRNYKLQVLCLLQYIYQTINMMANDWLILQNYYSIDLEDTRTMKAILQYVHLELQIKTFSLIFSKDERTAAPHNIIKKKCWIPHIKTFDLKSTMNEKRKCLQSPFKIVQHFT